MNNLITITAVLLFTSLGFAQGVEFTSSNYKEVLKQSAEQDKPIFIDFYATWCGPCKMMDKRVFSLDEIGGLMNENFINLKLDVEKGEGKSLANQYKITGMPTYVFINSDGDILHRIIGYIPQKKFETEAEFAMRKYLKEKKKK